MAKSTLPKSVRNFIRSGGWSHGSATPRGYARSLKIVNADRDPELLFSAEREAGITPDNALQVIKYVQNLRPNRDPAKEAARKAKYAKRQPQLAAFA